MQFPVPLKGVPVPGSPSAGPEGGCAFTEGNEELPERNGDAAVGARKGLRGSPCPRDLAPGSPVREPNGDAAVGVREGACRSGRASAGEADAS